MPGYEGLYEVSDMGRVRSVDRVLKLIGPWGNIVERKQRGKILAPLRHTGGYQRAMLWKDGMAWQTYVHTLVLQAFVGSRLQQHQVAHNNGNKQDNRLSNLRWATPAENQADRERHGTGKKGKPKVVNRVTSDVVIAMRRSAAQGKTITQVAKEFGVPRSTASDIINNKTRKEQQE